jgi:PAS domain S-box-containing protein
MTSALRRIFWPPTLETIEQTHRARIFHRVVIGTAAMLITLLLLLAVELPSSFPRRLNSILYCIALCVVLIPLNRSGRTRLASWLLVLSLTAVDTQRAWTSGGIAAPVVSAYIVIVLIAGLLLGTRTGIFIALTCLALGLGMALAEQAGRLPAPEVAFSPLARWLATTMWLGLAFLLQREVAVSLGESLHRSETELAERRQAEAALRAGEQRFRALIENASVAVRVSRAGITIYANRRFRELFGFARAEELVGQPILEQWAPESRHLVELQNRMLLESRPESGHYEATGLRRDGSRFPMEVLVSVVELPDGRASFASFADITARKEAEAEVLKEKVLSDTVINGMPGVFYMFDRDGKLVRWNDEFARIVGIDAETAGSHRLFDRIAEEDKAVVRAAVESAYAQGQATVEAAANTTTGKRHYHLVGRRLLSGNQTYLLGSGYDITARKEAEAALQAGEEQLRMLASHLQSVREAESRRIARAVHDEIGQLLTGLKMDLRWIEQGLEKRNDSPSNAILDRVVAATQLVDETVATVQRIAAELRPAILDQLGLFAALRHECQQLGQRSDMDCQFIGPAIEPKLPLDLATACYRIAQEALTNVVRHARATAVRIEIQTRQNRIVLEVRDNGRGIAPNAGKDINAHGLLGMRERARHHGGDVSVKPGANGGTIVHAEVPLPAAAEKT